MWTKLDEKNVRNVIYRRIFLPSATHPSRRHFYDPAWKAGTVFGGGVGSREVPKGLDVFRKESAEFAELTTDRSVDHDSREASSSVKAGASLGL